MGGKKLENNLMQLYHKLLLEEHKKFGWGMLLVNRQRLKELLAPASTHLDVGCNVCMLNKTVSEWYSHIKTIGIDIVEYPKTHKQFFIKYDGKRFPFKNDTFDVVTAIETLEHLTCFNCVLKEIARTLKPTGVFYFETLHKNAPIFNEDRTHKLQPDPNLLQTRLIQYFKYVKIYMLDFIICGECGGKIQIH